MLISFFSIFGKNEVSLLIWVSLIGSDYYQPEPGSGPEDQYQVVPFWAKVVSNGDSVT